ncbi:hypothetical protein B6A14_07775 [Polynucleobacter hirudinilacicola]|uniref:DUF883 domain-containing protein n=1 Tax=Polynucleobacter hirudinilacicola TaxID=1743166 RepID=A0A210RYM0_9BURK|nr:DUF883 family protein [Polynucleobacter hirudinilacicola]OWF66086.1 hypothetical protein B6A14_07775 [Polynucleobacter hirudinilacicola]
MTAKKSDIATEATTVSSDQLIGEFKALMADAEALIQATEGHADGAIGSIRSKALETIAGAKESLSGIESQLADKAKAAAASADDFVHRNPWEAVGVAAGLGLLIGLFIRRR